MSYLYNVQLNPKFWRNFEVTPSFCAPQLLLVSAIKFE